MNPGEGGLGTYGPIPRSNTPLFRKGESVVRLSLGRRSVNLLAVAQRTNSLINGVVDRLCGPLVVSSNLTFTVKTLFKEECMSSCQESEQILLDPQKLEPRVG